MRSIRLMVSACLLSMCLVSSIAEEQPQPVGELVLSLTLDLRHSVSSLDGLASSAVGEGSVLSGASFLLNGSLGSVISTSDDPYQSVVELLAGQWTSDSSLSLHRIWLLVDDPVLHDSLHSAEGQRRTIIADQANIVSNGSGAYVMLVRVRAVLPGF